ncbi:MAG: DUF4386 domain-containing protein [Chloroflexota bacterium]|nr:DUF4386 domain-containing protein [Chloroflexota bacterium]
MMRTTVVAAGLTRSWIRCYTLGLSRDTRVMRQEEIESDLWEHEREAGESVRARASFALAVLSRLVRGMPADVFWRFQMEGPKVEIKIPFERVAGALLLALVALIAITGGMSGYDSKPDGFDGELRRLAAIGSFADNGNAAIRLFTGLGLIAAAAGFYVALRERGAMLATVASFALVAAGILALVAGALQLVLVDLAEEYVASSGAHQEQVKVTARTVLQVVDGTVGAAMMALLLSTYSLAVLTARERLVPRQLIALPVLSVVVFVAGGIAQLADVGNAWIVLMSGVGSMLLWLVIAGAWLLFTPREERAAQQAMSSAAAG